jgi:hypothetical protein
MEGWRSRPAVAFLLPTTHPSPHSPTDGTFIIIIIIIIIIIQQQQSSSLHSFILRCVVQQ